MPEQSTTTTNTQNENNQQTNRQLKALEQANALLNSQLEAERSKVEAAETNISNLRQELSGIKAQMATIANERDDFKTEVEKLTTRYEEATRSLAEATSAAGEMRKKLNVYGVIAEDPEKYSSLIDIVDSISLPQDANEIKAVLDKFADKLSSTATTAATSAADAFKNLGAGIQAGGQPPSSNEPASSMEAFTLAMQALNNNDLDAFDRLTATGEKLKSEGK